MSSRKDNAVAMGCSLFLLLVVLQSMCTRSVAAKPADTGRYGYGYNRKDFIQHDCQQEDETEALCQRCAKSTKSPMVYPMCCRDEEEVRPWCVRYLGYGLH